MRHHLFYHESQLECSCSGNNKRFKEDGVTPVNTTTQIPLYQQLATFLNNKDSREQLLYRAKTEETRQLNVYRDVFDGDVYQSHKHLFRSDYDMAIALYIDGFNPTKRGSTSMVTFMAVILNLPPDIR